jgi:Spy/CpxP family protein refolding chaperone
MEDAGQGFGVRRPLRFMAHKLELREEQVAELAAILDELKTERAQAAVDHRRSVGVFADALGGAAFDEPGATAAADARVKSAERLRDAVVRALKRTHAMLDADQRKQLSYLLRSGQLTI